MRTTLDIDPRVLAAARARVSAGHNKSLGEAVSELAIAGLSEANRAVPPTERNGLVLLPSTPGHVVTDDMVAEALLDE
jgi:hypothetical protein